MAIKHKNKFLILAVILIISFNLVISKEVSIDTDGELCNTNENVLVVLPTLDETLVFDTKSLSIKSKLSNYTIEKSENNIYFLNIYDNLEDNKEISINFTIKYDEKTYTENHKFKVTKCESIPNSVNDYIKKTEEFLYEYWKETILTILAFLLIMVLVIIRGK